MRMDICPEVRESQGKFALKSQGKSGIFVRAYSWEPCMLLSGCLGAPKFHSPGLELVTKNMKKDPMYLKQGVKNPGQTPVMLPAHPSFRITMKKAFRQIFARHGSTHSSLYQPLCNKIALKVFFVVILKEVLVCMTVFVFCMTQ